VNKKIGARDIWALGLLVKEMFKEVSKNTKTSEMIEEMCEMCLKENFNERASPSQLLSHSLFTTSNFIQTINSLSTLTTMEDNKKKLFFSDLVNK
jgi:hypothetical protein